MSGIGALRRILFIVGFSTTLAVSVQASPAGEGLIAHLPLDGSAQDASGYGRHGTPENISFVSGRIDGAARLGQGSSILADRTPLEGTSFSVAAWVRLDSFGTQGAMQIVGQRDIETDGRCTSVEVPYLVSCGEWILNVYEHRFSFEIATRSDGQSTPELNRITAAGTPALNTYYSLVATFDQASGQLGLWVDGTLRAQQTVGTVLGIQPHANLSLGRNWPFGETQYWLGDIDDLRIYNRVLSDLEIGGLALPVPEPTRLVMMMAGLLWVCCILARQNRLAI